MKRKLLLANPKPHFAQPTPNYKLACFHCGALPTVDVVSTLEPTHHTELCGPCCWGEADTATPENW